MTSLPHNQLLPINNSLEAYDSLLNEIGDADVVLLGESTHGTREFYETRAYITQRLIEEKGFNGVAVEGDWPEVYEINRYIHGKKYTSAAEALGVFDKFPTWMWRNVSMLKHIEWLKEYNATHENSISIYGLDLYSLYASIDAVINYLESIDPIAAEEARIYYSCFEHYNRDPQAYAYAVFTKTRRSCEQEVLKQLQTMQQHTWDLFQRNQHDSVDKAFYAEQNARLIQHAEEYYRSMFLSDVNNWNIRDSHMFDTLLRLMEFNRNKGIERPKYVVWAHNSHIGDARATQMGWQGELNIGQLAKEKFDSKAFVVGFLTYTGSVTAAPDWHAPAYRIKVRPGMKGSYESFFHELHVPEFILPLKNAEVPEKLLERAIGVVYRPQTERASHYFYARLPEQFDALIYFDTTNALEPLIKGLFWHEGEEVPDTYPTGL